MTFRAWNADGMTPDASQNKITEAFKDKGMQRALKAMNARVISANGTAGNGAGLAAGTAGSSQAQVVNTLKYTIDGKAYSLDGTAYVNFPAFANPTVVGVIEGTYATQVANSYCKYLISVGTDGTAASGSGGLEVSQGNFATAAADAKLPDLPDGKCALGYVQIASGTGGFVSGTTGMNAAWLTVVYADLLTMPTDL